MIADDAAGQNNLEIRGFAENGYNIYVIGNDAQVFMIDQRAGDRLRRGANINEQE